MKSGFLILLVLFQFQLAYNQTSVLTQHGDNKRTGWNSKEKILNTASVSMSTFGKLYSMTVDDQQYAQPLVVSNLTIGGTKHNVVFAATANNTVYAFDGDKAATLWTKNYNVKGQRPPSYLDMTGSCGGTYSDFRGNIGIVGTPVIDSSSSTMYFVTRGTDAPMGSNGAGNYFQYFHAIDITTGNERANSPVLIDAKISGSGDGSQNGIIGFNAQHENQRPGLLLVKGVVYIAYASHCDWPPYHGWILGYDSHTLKQKIVFNTTPDGYNGGIWMSGGGPAADEQGNIYASVGNGSIGLGSDRTNVRNRSESAVKLVPHGNSLLVSSFFTPMNYDALENGDLDFGVTQMLLFPNTNLAITGCKDGSIYVMNRDKMGGYSASENNVLQTIFIGSEKSLRSSFSYYKGSGVEWLYTWSENAALKAFPYNRKTGKFDVSDVVLGSAQGPGGSNGSLLSVSSNGSKDATGILWASHAATGDALHATQPGILQAFDASDVTRELWNSNQNPRDSIGKYAKFVCPTIANGKVYMATFSNKLIVYGITKNKNKPSGTPVNNCRSPSNLKASAINRKGATLKWDSIPGVSSYNIQFKTAGDATFTLATAHTNKFELSNLRCGIDYLVHVQAVCQGKSIASNPARIAFSTVICDAGCGFLPTRWLSQDVGTIGIAGTSCYNNSTFRLHASGNGMSGSADGFQIAYKSFSGDGTITARVDSILSVNPLASAGVMTRESLDSTSCFALMALTRKGALFQYRKVAGSASVSAIQAGIHAPCSMKLVKRGTSYTGYISQDGITWKQVGTSVDLGFGSKPIEAGIVFSSHDNNAMSQAVFSKVPISFSADTNAN